MSSRHSRGQGQELLPCSNTPPAPLLLQQTPPEPLHLHGCSVSPAAAPASQPGRGGHGGAAGGGSTRGPALHGPGKARHWLPPSRCAAEMRRKTTLGASPHLPSSPRPRPRRLFHLPAPAALSSPPGGASRCPHRSRHRHLARRCRDQMAGHLAGSARPSLLGGGGKEDRSPLSPLQSRAECSGLPKSGCSHVPAEKSRHRDSV